MYLEDITDKNREEALTLQIKPEQIGFIESVEECLKESEELSLWRPVGIYEDDKMIGFAMYGQWYEEECERVWLDRFLIDQRYQNQGLGRQALRTLITYILLEYGCEKIYLSLYKDNTHALKLYESLGFYFTQEKDIHGEEVMVLDVF